jgi:hypothetical protein
MNNELVRVQKKGAVASGIFPGGIEEKHEDPQSN